MQTHQLVQGSPEWHAHRANSDNASDAPAMLGLSPYQSRADLVRQVATGIVPDVDARTQALFDEGHRREALARPLAEKIIGEELFPVVGSNGRLSASFDGLTMLETTAFEHKSLNDALRAAMVEGCTGTDLPMVYQVQCEQQCMVAEACERVLFMATKWDGDVLIEERHCWYTPNPELAERIRQGWAQFHADVAAYVPETVAVAPVARVIPALPALVVKVEGRVVDSNLPAFREVAVKFFEGISTTLESDQDFADAENTIKFCENAEERLGLVKQQTLSQTVSIDALFSVIDEISATARGKRLQLEKLVKARKDSIRAEIVTDAQKQLDQHIADLNSRLTAPWLARMHGPFAEAIKGKKSVATCREAAASALATAKAEASALATRMEANRKGLIVGDKDWGFLFADFAHVGAKPTEDFEAIATVRIQAHIDAEAERERKAKEAADAAAAAEKQTQAAAPAEPPAAAPAQAAPTQPATPAPRGIFAVSYGAKPVMVNLDGVCKHLGFIVTSEFLESIGFKAVTDRSAKQYRADALPAICDALIKHLQAKRDERLAA